MNVSVKVFRPFFGGVFLEGELATSSRFFDFAFRFFAQQGAAIPADGMQAMDDAIMAALQAGLILPADAYAKATDKNRFEELLPDAEKAAG